MLRQIPDESDDELVLRLCEHLPELAEQGKQRVTFETPVLCSRLSRIIYREFYANKPSPFTSDLLGHRR